MAIDITTFFKEEDPQDFSASMSEIGDRAGQITWNAAKQAAGRYQFITESNRSGFEDYVESFGAWDREEIESWTLRECTALVIQMIAGDMREFMSHEYDPDEWDWEEYDELAQAGQVSGFLYRGDNGHIYYSIEY